jgi:uncharacterized membrane protein
MLGDIENLRTSVWISYGFIHLAYFTFLLTPLLIRKSKVEADYRRPLYIITGAYFFVEFFVGLTLILIAPQTVKVTIIIQTILASLFLGWLLINLIVNEHTANNYIEKE